MITFKTFLQEQTKQDLKTKVESLCGSFLRRSGRNGLLYRGLPRKFEYTEPDGQLKVDDIELSYWIIEPPANRRPLSTPLAVHKKLDTWFEEHYGIKARSGVFAYGELGRDNADGYGSLAVIMPIGDFQYVWSPNVHDLFGEYEDNIDEFINGDDRMERFMGTLGFTMNDLDKAVMSDSEIMLDCDQYLAIGISVALRADHNISTSATIRHIKDALGIK